MAMIIANNIAAQLTMGEVRRNDTSLAKSLKKVSTGMRINGAADDASGYSITEKMRAQLRALEQDERNVQTGSSMLKVADGAVANIIEELRTIKELALNAANDTNTDMDRATIQKDVDNRLANINEIAIETNYNGKRLLDGTYGRGTSSPSSASSLVKPENICPGINFYQNGQTVTINEDGVYKLDGMVSRNRYTLEIDAENVVLEDFNTYGRIVNISIICKRPNTNLWLTASNLNFANRIESWGTNSVIRFGSGSNNNLILDGSTNITRWCPGDNQNVNQALVNIGGGLKIMGGSSGGSLVLDDIEEYPEMSVVGDINTLPRRTKDNAPTLGLDMGEQNSNADIIFDLSTVYVDVTNTLGFYGPSTTPAIGSGINGSIGDVIVEGSGYNSILGKPNELYVGVSNYGTKPFPNPIGAGENGTIGNVIYDSVDEVPQYYSSHRAYSYHGTTISAQKSPPSLVIHHGTKANQALNVYLEDMRLDAMGLADIKVTTQHNATAALQVVDEAIEYALDQATHIGAYISRLEFTEENIVTATENTRASESTFRDADMAREMMEYTKANVLLQASQSMLAQANQTASSVLNLLQ